MSLLATGVRDCGSTWQTERPLTPMNGKIPPAWAGYLPQHDAENIGKTPVTIVLIEIKSAHAR